MISCRGEARDPGRSAQPLVSPRLGGVDGRGVDNSPPQRVLYVLSVEGLEVVTPAKEVFLLDAGTFLPSPSRVDVAGKVQDHRAETVGCVP
jgi:hypothetical protein